MIYYLNFARIFTEPDHDAIGFGCEMLIWLYKIQVPFIFQVDFLNAKMHPKVKTTPNKYRQKSRWQRGCLN
jgi:hypothetical protein